MDTRTPDGTSGLSQRAETTPASPLLDHTKSTTPRNPFLYPSLFDKSREEEEEEEEEEDEEEREKRKNRGGEAGDGRDSMHRQSAKSLQNDAPNGGVGESRQPESFRTLFFHYWQEAISYCAVFWTFGMCVAFLGPTLLDIGCMISSGIQTTTWAFTSQLFFSLLGAALSGYVVERIEANYVLFVNTTIVPITMAILPFSRSIWSLTAILAVMGINMGFIDCIANLQMFKVFGNSVAPFLHALHFCYGTGAFVSPMISEPYLLNEDCTPFVEHVTDEPDLVVDEETGIVMYLNNSDVPAKTLVEAQGMTQIRYAFWIMAAVQAPVAILVFLLAYKMRARGWTPAHQEINQAEPQLDPKKQAKAEEKMKKVDESNKKVFERKAFMSERNQILFITVSTAAILFIYDGLQSSYGGFIYSYAVKSIADLNKTEAAYLNALFWGMFALGRLISIYLATKFTPAFMLLCNVMGCLMSMNLMLLLSHDHVALYVGTAVYGLFLSSVAPSSISMAEQYIDINSKITSFLVVVAATGEMVFPLIVGHLFAGLGPISFLVFCSLAGFLSVAVYLSLWIVGRTTPKHFANVNQSFIWCRMYCIQKPGIEHKHNQHDGPAKGSGDHLELGNVAP